MLLSHMFIHFNTREGMKVVAKAKADFYGKPGTCSLIIEPIQPASEGDLFHQFKELHAKLNAEALFAAELTPPFPHFPPTVAFVPSALATNNSSVA